ncbi:MAG: hypothetical protein AAGU05_09965, partial [Anaerolineaceae bacterium]
MKIRITVLVFSFLFVFSACVPAAPGISNNHPVINTPSPGEETHAGTQNALVTSESTRTVSPSRTPTPWPSDVGSQ